MTFEELEGRMRVFERAQDPRVLPGLFVVARIDGQDLKQDTADRYHFDSSDESSYRDLMTGTVRHLMNCGVPVIYGHTQGDEISLFFERDVELFDGRVGKIASILAAEAAAFFTLSLGELAAFDCSIAQLPRRRDVVEYFLWRQDRSSRNALSRKAYALLRAEGMSAPEATQRLLGTTVAERKALLLERGISFDQLPTWQRRGVGLYSADEVNAVKTGALICNRELPSAGPYREFISSMVDRSLANVDRGEI